MGDPAESITPAASPASAPASAPGGPGAPGGGSQQGTPTPKAPEGAPGTAGRAAGTSAQPTGQPAAPAGEGAGVPGKAVGDPHVPWRKFREAQTQLTEARRTHAGEIERVNAQIAQLTHANQQLQEVKGNYDILEQLIDENPDLAEQLYERAGKLRPRGGAAAPEGRPATDPNVLNELRQLRSIVENDRQAKVEATSNAKLEETDRQLEGQLRDLLSEHDLDHSWLPSAKEYVFAVARRIPTLDMGEVPYVFAEWAKPLQERLNNQLNTWRNGKLADQRNLPPSPNTSVAVGAREKSGALDRSTKAILEERLKQQLGWRNE